MPVEPTLARRPPLRLRADIPVADDGRAELASRAAVFVLGALFVVVGGGSLELGPAESRLGLASGEPIGPYGRAFGYWDPSIWPLPAAIGRAWAYFEEVGPTQGVVRWPSAIAGLLIGILLARRARLRAGPRAGLLVALGWFGSVALIDRSGGAGLDLITGLGTVAALDRLLGRGSGWAVGCWAAWAFLAGGWPPLAVLGLSTVVLGRSGMTWTWKMTLPVAAAAAAWSAWALATTPAQAWASALALPIKQSSAWGLALGAIALGLPWAPFALLARSRAIREGWSAGARPMNMGWLQVAGACLIVGTVVPGLASAALVPAIAGLAVVAASCWDRLWEADPGLPGRTTRGAIALALAIALAWFAVAIGFGTYVGFAIAYYRSAVIAVALVSLAGVIFALHGARRADPRWALGAIVAVSVAIKLAHWGYYVPEWNYRAGAGPWGRAIGQWVPEKHPVYVLHPWPADLAFAIGRPVRQLPSPQHIDFQPGEGSKFVLLQEAEYAEYLHWSDGWPRLIKVAQLQDEDGIPRILTRTDKPLIIKRPYRSAAHE